MNKLRISVRTLLLVVLVGTCVAESQNASSSRGVLVFSAKPSPHPSSFLLKSSRGVTYRLSLVPDYDVEKHVVVLGLVLQRPSEREDDMNLLDSTEKLHGYQPYDFAASDFAEGAQKSIYGESRIIDLPKLGMHIRVKVADVHVEPTSAGGSQVLGYQFEELTLEITTQILAEGSSNRPGQ